MSCSGSQDASTHVRGNAGGTRFGSKACDREGLARALATLIQEIHIMTAMTYVATR